MRVRRALLAAALVVPTAGVAAPVAQQRQDCPRTTSHLAEKSGVHRGGPMTPKKLNELPPATAYMGVYRQIGGCEAPLTMADYRNPRRR